MSDDRELRSRLQRIDGRSYRAYREIRGRFELPDCSLHIDHVQGDPFAAPSRLRARIPIARCGLPASLRAGRVRRLALADFLARELRRALRRRPGGERSGLGRSGEIEIDAGGQEVLERSAVRIEADWIEARLQVGLPAAGRRILGRAAQHLLLEVLPAAVSGAFSWGDRDQTGPRDFVECVENQEHIRARLEALGLVAFVANGAVLPRASGASDLPLEADCAVPFEAPASLCVEIELPNPVRSDGGERRSLIGMGVPRGVTLFVGGGYHGKSTLLRAIERGVYPHVPGDGREYVVSLPGLVKIRAEDGRAVHQVDIRSFIGRLPAGRQTSDFCSEDASGSTSQAANIAEAPEAGACGLLLDEDTCATNFMVRDARMQALIDRDDEPITPFLDRVRELYDRCGVSTLLVMGGCGDYFEVADRVISLRGYRPFDVTEAARRVARELPSGRRREVGDSIVGFAHRIPLAVGFDASRGRREVRIDAVGCERIRFGVESIELGGVDQLVDASQTRAVGLALLLASRRFVDGRATLRDVLDALDALFDEQGLDPLDPFHQADQHPGRLARPRRFEIAAAINRLRSVRVRQQRTAAGPGLTTA